MNRVTVASAGDKVREYIIDACVQVAKITGYSDASGVLKGSLLLATKPLSMDDLVEETEYSKSTISTNMNILENQGLVKRVRRSGDKRNLYVSTTSLETRTAMMNNLSRGAHIMVSALDRAERYLENAKFDENTEHLKGRIAEIRETYRQIEQLINLMGKYTTKELIEIVEHETK
ncbi:MAG: GbsR/MarR family transcriptional regulator [Methanotrichaceae archaeon]